MKKIAILCSGGDSQGMNTAVKTVVNMANVHGIKVMGIKRGYQGLIENDMHQMTDDEVQNIGNLGGAYLKVARCKAFTTYAGVKKAYDVLQKNKIEALVVIGGDGTFRGAMELAKLGAKIIAIPGTIDNDLFYSERTLGFDTAVNNAVSAIENIRQTMEANNRCSICEVMGRDCGDIALYVGVAVGAHSVVVKEENGNVDSVVKDIKTVVKNGVKSPIIVVSENSGVDIEVLRKAIESKCKIEARSTVIGYLQRGGTPSVFDKTFAVQLGVSAVKCIIENKTNLALGMQNKDIIEMKLFDAVNYKILFNTKLYNDLRQLYNLK